MFLFLLKNTDTQIQFSRYDISDRDEIITSEAVPFYAPETQTTYSKDNSDFSHYWHRAVELYFQDFSVLENQNSQKEQIIENFQLCLPQDKLVYKIEFPIQTKPLIFQSYTWKNNQWETVDHKGRSTKHSIPLLAYGGFYHPDHSLDKIQNFFAQFKVTSPAKEGGSYIIPEGEKPYLKLHQAGRLKEVHNMTLEGGKKPDGWFVYFTDSLPSSALLPLSEHLKQGLAEVILEDQTTKEKYCYISEDYKHDPKGPDHTAVDITFVLKMIKIEDELPSDLVLRVNIKPIPFQISDPSLQNSPLVTHNHNGRSHKSVPFYDISSAYGGYENLARLSWHKAVELRYQNVVFLGNYHRDRFHGTQLGKKFQLLFDEDNLVYRKNFYVQTQPEISSCSEIVNSNNWYTTDSCGRKSHNSTPLFYYGGCCPSELNPERIMPTFAIIGGHQDTTHLILYTLLGLKDKYVRYPKGGISGLSHWYFVDVDNIPEDFYRSLGQSIQNGQAEVFLQDKISGKKHKYVSKEYRSTFKDEEIDVYFIPKPDSTEDKELDDLPFRYPWTTSPEIKSETDQNKLSPTVSDQEDTSHESLDDNLEEDDSSVDLNPSFYEDPDQDDDDIDAADEDRGRSQTREFDYNPFYKRSVSYSPSNAMYLAGQWIAEHPRQALENTARLDDHAPTGCAGPVAKLILGEITVGETALAMMPQKQIAKAYRGLNKTRVAFKDSN
ncbi:MAG: hypothetical protein ACRYGR_10765 [Janthinobacterium lividum]